MAALNFIHNHKINKDAVTIIQENQSFMISKKDGLAVIKLYMIGINFKNYQHVQSPNILRIKIKAINFLNQTQFKMQLMH